MTYGLIAIFIMLVIVIGSVWTKRCEPFLLGGSLLGALLVFKINFIEKFVEFMQDSVVENVGILLIGGLFGSLIALLQASKGSFGFSNLISKFCKTERRTLLSTFFLGVLIFIDDYLNVLSIGACMKGVYDKRKLPRESLAYMLDATGAPVCVLLPFSTWTAFLSAIFYEQSSVVELGAGSAVGAYMKAIPFCLYPIITLIIVLLFSVGIMPKLGGMKKAYKRVNETGQLYSEESRKYNHEERKGYVEDGKIMNFIIPMGVLVAIAVATSNLLMAVIASMLVCFIMYIPQKLMSVNDYVNIMIKGFGDMLPLLILLVITFILQKVTDSMGMTEYIIDLVRPLLSSEVYPLIAFLLVSILTFTTASLWGICALVTPILFPIGAAIGVNPILIMAAIISGGAFGSHACFYTDATLLASQSSGIGNLEHALSQLPYVLLGAGLSCIGFVVFGFIM